MKKSNVIALSAAALTALLALVSFRPSIAAEGSDFLLHWPAATGEDAKYNSIDGKRMWQWIVEQGKIATDYRDAGHPQWWGRIAGTSGDEASVKWLLAKFKEVGVTQTKVQPMFYFLPQWNARSWSVSMIADGKSVNLESAQPPYGAPDTGNKEVDLEVVYVGGGSVADFKGRDVRGKAVLYVREGGGGGGGGRNAIPYVGYVPGQPDPRAQPSPPLKRAMDGGAAAILGFDLKGENLKYQAYRAYTTVPTFNLGTEDGVRLRDAAGGATPPRVKIRLDADWKGGQMSAMVWGTLPGATDETIYFIAHRDGWFQAAGDNATGVAGMLAIAEYFAKIPQAQRKRTMIFIGTDGHHNIRPGWYGLHWLAVNRAKYFSKTALYINLEHPAEFARRGNERTNAVDPNGWFAGGSDRPELEKIASDAFNQFGVSLELNPTNSSDLGYLRSFMPTLGVEGSGTYFHTDKDDPDNISWAGMESVVRAYAKIIDKVNELPLSALQAPDGPFLNLGSLDLRNCQAWIEDSSKPCTP